MFKIARDSHLHRYPALAGNPEFIDKVREGIKVAQVSEIATIFLFFGLAMVTIPSASFGRTFHTGQIHGYKE